MEKTDIRNFLILGLVLILSFLPSVHAQDYLRQGRLTKRTFEMERIADEIYSSDPENYIFNAMDFSKNHLKPEPWTAYTFMSAQESFEKNVGTCSEISVLYCAMMRYKGIPCTFRIIQVSSGHGDMFPVVYLNGSWYYPEKISNPNYGSYWVLTLDLHVMRGSLDRTNEFPVEEW